MRTRLFYALSALMMAMLLVVSCSKGGDEITPTPQIEDQTYTVTFDANGGEGSMEKQVVEEEQETVLTTNAFTRTDYTFSGWNTEADGSGTSYADNAKVTLSADLTIYAQWTEDVIVPVGVMLADIDADNIPEGNEWTILDTDATIENRTTFSGLVSALETKAKGEKITVELPNLTTFPEDALYDEWLNAEVTISSESVTTIEDDAFGLSEGFVSINLPNATIINGDPFYNRWDLETLVIAKNARIQNSQSSLFVETALSIIDLTTHPSNVVDDLYLLLADGTTKVGPFKSINRVIDSTEDPDPSTTCKVTFDANGGEGTMAPQTFKVGTPSTLTASTLTKTDYVFMGWATEATATVVLYGEEQEISPTENLTLYAVWYDLADVVEIGSDGNIGMYKAPYNRLTKFIVPASYKGTPITSVDINPTGSWTVGTLMKKLVISEGITTIMRYCFQGHNVLNGVTLPSTLKTIGSCAFFSCGNLMSITLPESLESIGSQAFESTALSEITLPASLKDLESSAIPTSLDNIYVAAGNTTYSSVDGNLYSADGKTFVRVAPNKESFTFGVGVETIGYSAFEGSEIAQIAIPETVTSIDNRAFEECENLKSITIPSQVTRVEDFLFVGCSALESVTFMGEITYIGCNTFRDAYSLKSITLPSSLIELGMFAFMGTGIESIVIPSSVSTIAEEVFKSCRQLTAINVEGKSERPDGWNIKWDYKDNYGARHTVNWNYVAE